MKPRSLILEQTQLKSNGGLAKIKKYEKRIYTRNVGIGPFRFHVWSME